MILNMQPKLVCKGMSELRGVNLSAINWSWPLRATGIKDSSVS